MAALAEGWAAHADAEGNTFYANATTGESSWEFPAAAYAAPAAEVPYVAEGALPEGWAEHMDPGSGRCFYFHAATNETSWEKPAAPAGAAPAAVGTWSVSNTYTIGTEAELTEADATSGGVMRTVILDRATFSSVVSTIANLEANQVPGQERGFVIIWSNSKQNYFLLWRDDKEYEAFTQLNIPGGWSISNSKELGGLGSDHIFSGRAHLLDTNTFTSCTASVEKLNTTRVPGAYEMGFCVIFSQSQQQYVLLYGAGKEEMAFAALGLSMESAAAG